jgi:putative methylase
MDNSLDGDSLRLKHLAIELSKLAAHPCHEVSLEQYQTEGDIAARWLTQIDAIDGLEGKRILDLGAGNGILGFGARLLGAEVIFVECDEKAAALCRELGETIEGRVGEVELPEVDMVIMNPPWGRQIPGSDKIFITEAQRVAPIIHLMHSAGASHLPEGEIILEGEFRLPAKYQHHKSRVVVTPFRCWRIVA